MLSFLPKTPNEIMDELRVKFKIKRKNLKITQKELAIRSSVSLGSIKRFEASGQISLESLLKLALVLECLEEFSSLCKNQEKKFQSIDEVIGEKL